jgi:phage terminase large subunit
MQITWEIPNPESVFNDNILKVLESYKTRIEVYYGGASSGKSQGVYQKVVIKALQPYWNIPRKVLILRKVNNSIRDSSWAHVKEVLSDFQLLEYCKVRETDKEITLPNGAMLLFRGLDDPEKIKSIKGISDIVMEEATEFTADDFEQLNLRLRDANHLDKQIFLMFNPVSKKNWVFNYFFIRKVEGAVLYWSTYKDNKFLDDITRIQIEGLKHRNPAYYRIYALGEFATLDKLVFPVYTKRLIGPDEVRNYPLLLGLDFGFINDPSALVNVRYDITNKRVFIVSEYVGKNLLNDQIAKNIVEMGYSKELIFADSAEQKSIEEIRRLGVERIKPVTKGPDSVIHGIQWLSQQEIIIDERCFKVLEEFENYTWVKDKKTGEYINEPVDSYNHTIDAIRYALSEYIQKGNSGIRLLNKRALGIR